MKICCSPKIFLFCRQITIHLLFYYNIVHKIRHNVFFALNTHLVFLIYNHIFSFQKTALAYGETFTSSKYGSTKKNISSNQQCQNYDRCSSCGLRPPIDPGPMTFGKNLFSTNLLILAWRSIITIAVDENMTKSRRSPIQNILTILVMQNVLTQISSCCNKILLFHHFFLVQTDPYERCFHYDYFQDVV